MTQSEGPTLDFKSEYLLDNAHHKSKFIKDILSMANTERMECSYIIVGVKAYADNRKDFIGVQTHPDDAELQQFINLARIDPKPSFTYQAVTLDGKSYGVISIPVAKSGPYFANRDFDVVKQSAIYFRQGSQNDVATPTKQKEIYDWFRSLSALVTPPLEDSPRTIPNWDKLAQACHGFDPNRLYIFILGPDQNVGDIWRFLGRVPMSLVLDFDPRTEKNGAYKFVRPVLEAHRSVHLLAPSSSHDEGHSFVPEKACYWFAARGLESGGAGAVELNWRAWNRQYSREIAQLFSDYVRASAGRPITLVSLWYGPEFVREVCRMADAEFADVTDYVFAVPDATLFTEIADHLGGTMISIELDSVLYGISQNIAEIAISPASEASIPGRDGVRAILQPQTLNWLSEDLEVLHSGVETQMITDRELGTDFLRGATIDSAEDSADLRDHFDAERDKTPEILKLVESDLQSRITSRFNLYHWPGGGGTTVARRVAWELRRQYPTVLLRNIRLGQTIGRLQELFTSTSQSILAVVEAADVPPDLLEHLYLEARSNNIPVVFLVVLRRFEVPRDSDHTAFLARYLNLVESFRFAQAFKRVAPERSAALDALVQKPNPADRIPFGFALTTFEHDYRGLPRYVTSRLETASQVQRQLLVFLAIAYYYGHKPVPAQFFAAHLGSPENRPLRLELLVQEPQRELLIQEQDGLWRPSHHLIAEQILKLTLSGSNADTRTWAYSLSDWAVDLIMALAKSTAKVNDDLYDLLSRIFILRDERELLGTESSGTREFSGLIQAIPTSEGQVRVLKTLAETFPENPHFWGHLGRFYSIEMKEPLLALEALERAMRLDNDDPVLHHMTGMIYREMAYTKITDLRRDETQPSPSQLREFQQLVEDAKTNFATARELDPTSEHAYISPIQLLLRVLDFGYTISGSTSRSDFLVQPGAQWYREQLDEVETLMDAVRSLREGERPSEYIVRCQANLFEIYDNYARALEGWTNLLNRRDVYLPPIRRQLVRALLGRKNHDWSALTQAEIERIVELMSSNLKEEPTSDSNIRMWFRAYRHLQRPDVDTALDRLASWRAVGDALEAYYYLYILHVLKAIDGSMIERVTSEDLLKQCAQKARTQRNRTQSFEWFGKGVGLKRLHNHNELGDWDKQVGDFYKNTTPLERVEGRVGKIVRPESGTIELLSCGLPVFFVPGKVNVLRGRDENARVTFYLGFSYEGLRAWSVERH